MCGRYRRTTSEEELARLYHIPIPSQKVKEGSDHPLQSANATELARRLAVGINPLLG